MGEVIAGKYRVDRLIGVGGMGVVVAATHLELSRPVAIKLVRPELHRDPGTVERLVAEARAAARSSGQHVVAMMDVGRLPNGAPFIVMEYLEGEDLATLLEREGPMRIEKAVDLLLQACEAVAEAHLEGLVHRDLKPANLFLARVGGGSASLKA